MQKALPNRALILEGLLKLRMICDATTLVSDDTREKHTRQNWMS
jgi:hypothetical protein